MSTLRRLLALADVPRRRVAVPVGLGAAAVVCGVGLSAASGYLITRAAERPAILSLTVAIVTVRFFALARPIVRYLERLSAHDVALRALGHVRVGVFRRIEPLAPVEIGAYRHGDLLARLVADVDALQGLHLRGLDPPLVALLAGAVSVGVTAAFLPAAAVALAVGLTVAGLIVPALTGRLGRRAARERSTLEGELTADVVELVHGAPELVVHGCEDERLERVRELDARLVRCGRRAAIVNGLADGLLLVVIGATVAVVLAIAVDAHAAGRLDRVVIAALALLALASFEAVQPLGRAARELEDTLSAGRRVLELVDRRPRVRDAERTEPLPAWPYAVALEGVRVRYGPGDGPALDGVSLRLEPGKRIALVGPSGAGKTTVANLLLRFLDPEQGRVTMGGADIRVLAQADVRRAIAVAGQESHLFSTSIYENVRLARPDACEGDVERALRLAGLWDFVQTLDDGWHTRVGENGRELSGGQRQRASLARAFLAEAPVLVLDEPTAHLDRATAEAIMSDVFAATEGRSLLVITHRPEGLDLVDEIVELGG